MGEQWKLWQTFFSWPPKSLWMMTTVTVHLNIHWKSTWIFISNQPWKFIGRTDAEADAPIVWPPDTKSWLNGKDPGAGKDWGQEEKESTEDEMIGWHHRLSGHEFEQCPRNSEGQRSLVGWSSWGCRVRHNWVTELQHQNSKLYSDEEGNAELDTSSKEIVQNAIQGETKIRSV